VLLLLRLLLGRLLLLLILVLRLTGFIVRWGGDGGDGRGVGWIWLSIRAYAFVETLERGEVGVGVDAYASTQKRLCEGGVVVDNLRRGFGGLVPGAAAAGGWEEVAGRPPAEGNGRRDAVKGFGVPARQQDLELPFHSPSDPASFMLATACLCEELGGDSAKDPQVTHQNSGPLFTVQCFLKALLLAEDLSYALVIQLTTALPLQLRDVSRSKVADLVLQAVHHHPVLVASMVWPPSLLLLGLLLLAAVTVGPGRCADARGACGEAADAFASAAAAAFCFRLTAAASAALALDAWVSRVGSSVCWLAMSVARAIHMALAVVNSSCSATCLRICSGTL
jgi:hypothetical protein